MKILSGCVYTGFFLSLPSFFNSFLSIIFFLYYSEKWLLYSRPLDMPGNSRFTVLPGINNKKLAKCLNAWSLILHTNVKDKPSRTADLSPNSAI